jgi:hypothetical protein
MGRGKRELELIKLGQHLLNGYVTNHTPTLTHNRNSNPNPN